MKCFRDLDDDRGLQDGNNLTEVIPPVPEGLFHASMLGVGR